MKEETLKKILRDFPWLWAISPKWDVDIFDVIHIQTAGSDNFTGIKVIPEKGDKLWIKTTGKIGFKTQWIEKITPETEMKVSDAVVKSALSPAIQKIDCVIVLWTIPDSYHKREMTKLNIFRKPKGVDFNTFLGISS